MFLVPESAPSDGLNNTLQTWEERRGLGWDGGARRSLRRSKPDLSFFFFLLGICFV